MNCYLTSKNVLAERKKWNKCGHRRWSSKAAQVKLIIKAEWQIIPNTHFTFLQKFALYTSVIQGINICTYVSNKYLWNEIQLLWIKNPNLICITTHIHEIFIHVLINVYINYLILPLNYRFSYLCYLLCRKILTEKRHKKTKY